MKKFLETSFGSKGVDTLPPVRIAFNNLFTVYDGFQKLMEPSAYIPEDKDGRKIRQTFPVSNRSDTFYSLVEKFKAEKRNYIRLQKNSMDENPEERDKVYSKESTKTIPSYLHLKAVNNCWPNTKDDVAIKNITDKVNQISTLVNLRKNFEIQIQKYGAARYILEDKLAKIESSVNVIEAVAGLEGAIEDALTPMLEKAKYVVNEGFKLATETARAFNSACMWSIVMLPSPEHAGSYSWFTV